MTNESKLLTALVEKPTRYYIDIKDNSMLPEHVSNKKVMEFVIKPPTLQTLAQCAIYLQEIPKELLEAEQINLKDASPYLDQMVKVICTLSYAKKEDYPDWYESFIKANATPKDIFYIFHETSMKMGTDFFLRSFQIASLTNPMMMKTPKSSIPTS